MPDQISQIAASYVDAIRSVLGGTLTLEQLRSHWRIEVDQEKLLWRLMSEAEHFLIDQDIRAKDSGYERYQRELLAALIADVITKYKLPEPEDQITKPAQNPN